MSNILFKTLFFFLLNLTIWAQNIDIDVLRDINVNRNKELDGTFKFFSNTTGITVAAIPVGIFTAGLINNDTELKQIGLQIFASAAGTALISYCSKYIFGRNRPYETYKFIDNLDVESTPSMPSTHTALAFSSAMSLSLQYPKWYVIAPSALWASAVAYSRMHLGVHYPSDILVGAIVGIGVSLLTYQLQKSISK